MPSCAQAAIEGQGVALGIEELAVDDIAAGRLVVPFDHRLKLLGAYYLTTLEEQSELAQVTAFRKWILEETRKFCQFFPHPVREPKQNATE